MIEKGEPPEGGDALIMDFGIARSVEQGSTQTAAGAIVGTVEYMAPEQARGQKVDQRADIYSFGLILYDSLIGRQRLRRAAATRCRSCWRASASRRPRRARSMPRFPRRSIEIVQRCLDPEADARFQTTIGSGRRARSADARWPPASDAPSTAVLGAGGHGPSPLATRGRRAADCAGGQRRLVFFRSRRGRRRRRCRAAHLGTRCRVPEQHGRPGVQRRARAGLQPRPRRRDASSPSIRSVKRCDRRRPSSPAAGWTKPRRGSSAVRDGIKLVLLGSVGSAGVGLHGVGEGAGRVDGREVATVERQRPMRKDEVLAAVGEMAARLRRALGDTERRSGRIRPRNVHRRVTRGGARIRAGAGSRRRRQVQRSDRSIPGGRSARSELRSRLLGLGERRVSRRPARGIGSALEEVLVAARAHDRAREIPHARRLLPRPGRQRRAGARKLSHCSSRSIRSTGPA